MQLSAAFFALVVASGVYAADITVQVGASGVSLWTTGRKWSTNDLDTKSLAYSPSSITAQAGDNVIFEFQAKNHSVTQSTFASPCSFMPNGVNSGFMAVTNSSLPIWNITISNASTPLWFFCAQTNPVVHCNQGMVFAINPTADKSFAAFQVIYTIITAAKTAAVSLPPPDSASSAAPIDPSAVPSAGAGAPTVVPSAGTVGGSGGSPPSAASSAVVVNGAAPSPVPGSSQSGSATANSPASSSTDNGAPRMGASASGILALAGLVAGLML
ncbi:hypothetical protein C0995_015266 [Termitomyces sp. Mi166|nr:hypothetical protein C0995_015266 [Termitomyces sp. Mi166\